jgi:sterol desaturase/sphingolipid hydroxylase (fatty acid hydroxylase superfamily)
MMKLLFLAFLFAVAFAVPLTAQLASQPPGQLETRVSLLESKVAQFPSQGLVLFLFGAVCALWAMNTGRNSWLCFLALLRGWFYCTKTLKIAVGQIRNHSISEIIFHDNPTYTNLHSHRWPKASANRNQR